MIRAEIGRSNHMNSFEAGKEACEIALKRLGEKPNLILTFSTSSYDQKEILKGIRNACPEVPVVGCSSSGEITTEGPLSKHIVLMALKTERIKFVIEIGKGAKENSFEAGKAMAKKIKDKALKDLKLLIILTEGLPENGAAIVRGIQSVLGRELPIIGGAAGDDFQFKETYQYFNEEVLKGAVIGIGLCGDFSFGIGVKHGWEPIGLPMKVTRSKGAKLIEVDNQPALHIYEGYFGKKAEELIKEPIAKIAYTYPLGMKVGGTSELLIRDVVIANEKGEIDCAAEIPEGAEIRLMLSDPEKAILAAKEAALNALTQLNNLFPQTILVFDCMARRKLLGQKAKEEISAIQEILGKRVALIGFYTYGEIAPLGGELGKECFSVWHNETLTLLTLAEE